MVDGLLPFKHLSFSSMRQFMTSENLFFKKYIRWEFDEQEHPAMLIGKAVHKGLEKMFQDTIDGNEPIPYIPYADAEFTKMLMEARMKTRDKVFPGKFFIPKDLKVNEPTVEGGVWMIETGESSGCCGITREDCIAQFFKTSKELLLTPEEEQEIEKIAIKWGKKDDEPECRKKIAQAMTNYFSIIEYVFANETVISTEISETVLFSDLEGNVMPIPLKGIIDKIVRHKVHGKGLKDYKVVAMLSDPNERHPGYELQAAFFYFIYYGLKGEAPEFCEFEEILKGAPGLECVAEPGRKLLQADLKELCDQNSIEYGKFAKNVELQEKLLEIGVLRQSPTVQAILYRYEDRKDILEAALEVYRRIVNRLGIVFLMNAPYDELLNPFDRMSGLEAWKDFTETLENQIDTKVKSQKEAEAEALEELDEYEF